MVEKPAYCMHCRHIFEYDTATAECGRFRYALKCPNCGRQNRVLKEEYEIFIHSAGIFLGIFLGWYFLFHSSFAASLISALAIGTFSGLASYYFRVSRSKRARKNGS